MIGIYLFLTYAFAYLGLFLVAFYALTFLSSKEKDPGLKSDKSVSIIIPAWNEAPCIRETIKSALELNYPRDRFEVIVVDDGSTDKTYDLAKGVKSPYLRVFTKKNGGKGSALNYGIARAKGEIVVTMDADTMVDVFSLQRMVARFYNDRVMGVTSAMGVYKPRTLWQRVQHIEYYLSLFLRTAYARINAVFITPGAFSAYRKSFFEKYGGFDTETITEDMEVALRIQYHDYIIEHAPQATFYTIAPASFKALFIQRRRWYTGMIQNLIRYREMYSIKKGALGSLILPSAALSIMFSIVLVAYALIRIAGQIRNELLSLSAIDFRFYDALEFNRYVIGQFFYSFFSNPVYLFLLFFILLTGFYLAYARYKMRFKESLIFNFALFMVCYSMLFAFWWSVAFVYTLFGRKVKWGKKIHE